MDQNVEEKFTSERAKAAEAEVKLSFPLVAKRGPSGRRCWFSCGEPSSRASGASRRRLIVAEGRRERALLCVRASSHRQAEKGLSVPGQLRELRRYCFQHRYRSSRSSRTGIQRHHGQATRCSGDDRLCGGVSRRD